MRINLGKWNNIQLRARQWLYLMQFAMVSAVYLKLYEFHWWHLIVPILFIFLVILDQKKIYPEEIDYWWKKGKIPSDVYRMIKDLHQWNTK